MPALIGMIENLWIQHGPMLNYLYPEGHPTYEREHQHVYMLRAMRKGDADALCQGVRDDLIEGGAKFLAHLQALEQREAEGGK
jgi:DNA-binding GntR family transcriptional regulator